jgi:HK97 family phage major capsid protein
VAVGEPDRIFGYPFDWNADMDTVAAGHYPVVFGDFTKYIIRDVGGVTVVRYNELKSRANLAVMPSHEISSDCLESCDGNEAQAEEFIPLAA